MKSFFKYLVLFGGVLAIAGCSNTHAFSGRGETPKESNTADSEVSYACKDLELVINKQWKTDVENQNYGSLDDPNLELHYAIYELKDDYGNLEPIALSYFYDEQETVLGIDEWKTTFNVTGLSYGSDNLPSSDVVTDSYEKVNAIRDQSIKPVLSHDFSLDEFFVEVDETNNKWHWGYGVDGHDF